MYFFVWLCDKILLQYCTSFHIKVTECEHGRCVNKCFDCVRIMARGRFIGAPCVHICYHIIVFSGDHYDYCCFTIISDFGHKITLCFLYYQIDRWAITKSGTWIVTLFSQYKHCVVYVWTETVYVPFPLRPWPPSCI